MARTAQALTTGARVRRLLAVAVWCALAGGAMAAAPDWRQLTPAQQQALAPLHEDWNDLSEERREKWLRVATRYPKMNDAERERLHSRMREWAQLTPGERGLARLRYQESRRISPEQRQARWAEYQALPAEERARLAGTAGADASASPAATTRPARAATEPASAPAAAPKSNLVQGGGGSRVPMRPVAPTVVQAKPGATTTLISRPAAPPAHQSTGLPKIAAGPEVVNRTTLLPTRGAQGAAVSPAAPAEGSNARP